MSSIVVVVVVVDIVLVTVVVVFKLKTPGNRRFITQQMYILRKEQVRGHDFVDTDIRDNCNACSNKKPENLTPRFGLISAR